MTVKLLLDTSDLYEKNLLDTIAKSVVKSRKTLVITGAGVSCNAGIPDFRSSDGLYNMVKHQYPDSVVKGKDLFDTVLFSSPESTSVFFTFMTQLRRCILDAHSTPTHKFIKHLKDKRKLLRCYTQNIDGLEEHEGLSSGVGTDWKNLDVIQLHGDIHSLKCMHCAKEFKWESHSESALDKGEMVACPGCTIANENRINSGKRGTSIGFLRPNIVLYGEEHPNGDIIGKCTTADLKSGPDCMIILGTSLKVHGIKKLVRDAAKRVKDKGGLVIFVNKTEISKSMWNDVIDYHIESDCDEWVRDLKSRQPNFFSVQTKLPSYSAKKRASEGKENMDIVPKSCPGLLTPPATPVKRMKYSEPILMKGMPVNRGDTCLDGLFSNLTPRALQCDTPSASPSRRRSPRLSTKVTNQPSENTKPLPLDLNRNKNNDAFLDVSSLNKENIKSTSSSVFRRFTKSTIFSPTITRNIEALQ